MLQKEFKQLTGIKVSEGDIFSVVPTVIETVKRTANFEGYQEGQDEIHDLKMQIAAKDEVIREKDELLQAQLEDIKKTIRTLDSTIKYLPSSRFF